MSQYKVQHDYRSDRGGFSAGDKVDLEDHEADWFNADSPGLLEPVGAKAKHEVKPEPVEEPQVEEPEPAVEVTEEPSVEVDDGPADKPKRARRS